MRHRLTTKRATPHTHRGPPGLAERAIGSVQLQSQQDHRPICALSLNLAPNPGPHCQRGSHSTRKTRNKRENHSWLAAIQQLEERAHVRGRRSPRYRSGSARRRVDFCVVQGWFLPPVARSAGTTVRRRSTAINAFIGRCGAPAAAKSSGCMSRRGLSIQMARSIARRSCTLTRRLAATRTRSGMPAASSIRAAPDD